MGRVFSSIHKVQSHPSRNDSQVHNLKNQEKISEMGRIFHLLFGSLLSLLVISPITQALYSRLRHLFELTQSSLTTCQRRRHVHLRVDVMTYPCIGEGPSPLTFVQLRACCPRQILPYPGQAPGVSAWQNLPWAACSLALKIVYM